MIVTYPDGSQLTTSALTEEAMATAIQLATALMLGILINSVDVSFTFAIGNNVVTVPSTLFLYQGLFISCANLPDNTLILAVGPGNTITFSTTAIASGTFTGTVSDPNMPSKVRIGWQEEGQPGPDFGIDTAFILVSTTDSEYSRLRDNHLIPSSGNTITELDVSTRRWKVDWILYGPNSLINARAIASGLIKVPYIESFLNGYNLFVDPDIKETNRDPEKFQGRWWERADVSAEFNEQVTETLVIGTVGSVEVKVYTKDGLLTDFTVTT